MPPVMVTVPVPALIPELVMLPVLLIALVVKLTAAAVAALFWMMRLPVPVTPLETVRILAVPTVSFLIVVPPLFTLIGFVLMVRAEVVLFSVMLVTLEPMPPLIVVVPVVLPLLMMVPVMLIGLVEKVTAPVSAVAE